MGREIRNEHLNPIVPGGRAMSATVASPLAASRDTRATVAPMLARARAVARRSRMSFR